MPVFGTSAATFDDDGVSALYGRLARALADAGLHLDDGALEPVDVRHSTGLAQILPPARVRYLAEIAESVRGYHALTERQVDGPADGSGSPPSGTNCAPRPARKATPTAS